MSTTDDATSREQDYRVHMSRYGHWNTNCSGCFNAGWNARDAEVAALNEKVARLREGLGEAATIIEGLQRAGIMGLHEAPVSIFWLESVRTLLAETEDASK